MPRSESASAISNFRIVAGRAMAESSHQTMRYPRMRWLVIALSLAPAIALAAPHKLADGYELAFAKDHIEIRRGTQRARLIAAAGIHKVTFDPAKRTVT